MALGVEKHISRRECAVWALGLLISFIAIFTVPKFVPLSPSISSSYVFGYNNRAGVTLLFVFLAIAALLARRLRISFPPPAPAKPVSSRAVALWMAAFALLAAIMWFLCQGLHGYGESIYLVDRLKLIVSGQRPYRDFEYAYGVLFLWLPLAFVRLGLTLETSYFLSWTLISIAGVWLLARVLNLLDRPSPWKTRIFHIVCLYVAVTLLSAGMNYSLVRFLLAAWFGLIVQRVDVRQTRYAMLLAAIFTVVLLGVSPEIAISYAFGSVVYFAVFGFLRGDFNSRANILAFAALPAAEIAIFSLANRLQVFETMKAFRTGAFNFPIVPAVHILFFAACCSMAALFVSSRLHRGARGDGTSMVIAVSALNLFAALGRCDPAHVVLNGLSLLLVAAVLVSSMPRAWFVFQWAFVLLIFAIPTAVALGGSPGGLLRLVFIRAFALEAPGQSNRLDAFIERGMRRQLGPEKGAEKVALYRSIAHIPRELDIRILLGVPGETLEAPFGFRPVDYGTNRTGLDFGYYLSLLNAFTPESVQRKIAEIEAHPDRKLLLPEDFEASCVIVAGAEAYNMSKLFLYPYHAQPRNEDDVWMPLCTYIDTHYTMQKAPTPETFHYGLWTPK